MLLTLGLSFGCFSFSGERGPVIPQGEGEHCVADTEFMRRNHMDLIVHQRDETVIRGLRDEPFSLVECVDCHTRNDAEGKAVRIDAKGEFCASCHEFVAVKIDCFSCHAAVPDGEHGDTALYHQENSEDESTHDLIKRAVAHLETVDSGLLIDKGLFNTRFDSTEGSIQNDEQKSRSD